MDSMSVLEVAEYLGVSKAFIYKLAAPQGPIPCYRMASRLVFDRSDVEAYKVSCRCEPVVKPYISPTKLRTTRIRASDPESSLLKLFAKHGIKPKLAKPV